MRCGPARAIEEDGGDDGARLFCTETIQQHQAQHVAQQPGEDLEQHLGGHVIAQDVLGHPPVDQVARRPGDPTFHLVELRRPFHPAVEQSSRACGAR
ncbi:MULTISPECIES: hypothetical protein [Actinoalloteichus]|uniref:hypothetical protein n=1 Tax=Actinoalloteichus TaxID=65496 RepID=UPI0009515908|nr:MULTISPECIES: hypothetical protein [Actinoalloteichus]